MKTTQILKKQFYTLALASAVAITIFPGCQSSADKTKEAESNVEEAKADLKEAKKDANDAAQVAVSEEEWKAFRAASEEKIRANDVRIAELKVKLQKPGKILDSYYEKRIAALEEKNAEMKAKLDAYEKSQSDWESFKREFNHDMDELGQSLKDFSVDNKK